jgi:hypothetical protein
MKPTEEVQPTTLEVSEVIPCVLTAPATLHIRLDGHDPRRPDVRLVRVELDEVAFEFAPDPPIADLGPAELPRLRAAVLQECEQRLVRQIAALEAEWALADDGGANGSGQRSAEARERALRHAGLTTASGPPPAVDDSPPRRFVPMPAGSYVAGRWERAASSYLPSSHDGVEPAWSARATGFGRGLYIQDVPATSPQASVAPARPAHMFPAPPRPGSSEHETARRLLRYKDLLRALRAR